MHLTSMIVAGLAALSTSIIADKLVAVEGCDADLFVVCGLYYAHWHSAFGVHPIDAHDGCRDPDVPGMNEICIDWPRGRGHFRFDNQGKRCFLRGDTQWFAGDGCWGIECWRSTWNEVPCSWREIPPIGAATANNGSIASNGTIATRASSVELPTETETPKVV